ncbi:MAG: DUF4249 domain-containing protein [Bacteroidales bacterium]
MRTVILILTFITGLVTSCSKVYDPHINTTQNVLVVDGMVTNKTDAYHVFLTYAVPFNSSEKGTPVSGANIYVTDNLASSYKFNERTTGDYVSDSLQFTGQAGHTYQLHVATPDGAEYESDPQKMFPEVSPDKVYAEFDNEEVLSGVTGLKVNTHGADILIDITNQSDTFPRFRLTSNLVMQYYYYETLPIDIHTKYIFQFYCWQTINANTNINLTGGEYFLNSASIKKHPVCFLDDNFYVWAIIYDCLINMADTTGSALANGYQFYEIHHRILYLSTYTLNTETYLYYKNLDEQMQSEGKLFDPVASQLTGNIKCITNPEKKAIGFFEASSVSSSEYVVDFRDLESSQPTLIKEPYIQPPELNGCQINRLGIGSIHHNIPSFWIF